ncbi:helix-turn-helix transcriptional regulator [Mycobacterium sp. 050134]|uniref:helix-turn-helix transcriptional regulator n=1 Tax=Mycobacterium sp. 050134 TaxID=3096111 RepID=UPI002EDBB36E
MTSLTENTAPGVAVGSAGQFPGEIRVDARPDGHSFADARALADFPPAVRHEQFRAIESHAVRRFFADAYSPGWRVSGVSSRSALTHRRCETAAITVDEVLIQGRATLEVPAGDTFVVIQPRAGSLAVAGGSLPTPDCPVLVARGMSCTLQVNGARFDVVSVLAEALHKAVPEWTAPLPRQAQFLGWRPRSRAAVRAWHRALDYVTATLASPDTAQQPLIVAAMAPLLAGALLECYPSTLTDQEVTGDTPVPETLKDAVSFIHRNASGEVGINDVAAAVHLTPRAVQYLFRRQLNTTPTEYMRRVRLSRAHQDLSVGTPSTTTVTEIAQRWGFAHTGRFAVLYRQTYGQSPHSILRQ